MQYHYFINFDTGELLKLPFNKKNLKVKYLGKWIAGTNIYQMGFQDPNMSGKCTECDKPINNYKWDCEDCHKRRQKANLELTGELNQIFGSVFKK